MIYLVNFWSCVTSSSVYLDIPVTPRRSVVVTVLNTPSLWWSRIYIYSFWIFHLNWGIENVVFWIWIILLGILFLGFIYAIEYISTGWTSFIQNPWGQKCFWLLPFLDFSIFSWQSIPNPKFSDVHIQDDELPFFLNHWSIFHWIDVPHFADPSLTDMLLHLQRTSISLLGKARKG